MEKRPLPHAPPAPAPGGDSSAKPNDGATLTGLLKAMSTDRDRQHADNSCWLLVLTPVSE